LRRTSAPELRSLIFSSALGNYASVTQKPQHAGVQLVKPKFDLVVPADFDFTSLRTVAAWWNYRLNKMKAFH